MITRKGIEIPVGECLLDEKSTYMAIRPFDCGACAFIGMDSCASIACMDYERTDGKGVHFIKLKGEM